MRAAIGGREFGVVVSFLVFDPERAARDIQLFSGRTGQYVFISTARSRRGGAGGRQESVVAVSSGWPRPRKKMPGKPDVEKPAFGLPVSRECPICSVPVRSLLT